jgi:hypothetical protein
MDLTREINQNLMDKFKFIFKNFSDKVLEELIFNIEEKCFVPNEIIF